LEIVLGLIAPRGFKSRILRQLPAQPLVTVSGWLLALLPSVSVALTRRHDARPHQGGSPIRPGVPNTAAVPASSWSAGSATGLSLLFHASLNTGAALSEGQAAEVAETLRQAARQVLSWRQRCACSMRPRWPASLPDSTGRRPTVWCAENPGVLRPDVPR
jgi:hypothetical protein